MNNYYLLILKKWRGKPRVSGEQIPSFIDNINKKDDQV